MRDKYRTNIETASPDRYEILLNFARKNRQNPTIAEEHIWNLLKDPRITVKFRRQHIIGDYIVDFVCLPLKLILEIDGKYHFTPEQEIEDKIREQWLNRMGYTIVRINNENALYDSENTITLILNAIERERPAARGSKMPRRAEDMTD